MPALRTSEQLHWSEDIAKSRHGQWGCPKCGFEDSYVRDVDKDTEFIRVRRRQCCRCGEMWETEEHRIATGSFFARAETRRYAAYRKTQYEIRTCRMCRGKYQATRYFEHTEQSEAHKAVVARREERKKKRVREYNRRWMATKRAIARAQLEEAA